MYSIEMIVYLSTWQQLSWIAPIYY